MDAIRTADGNQNNGQYRRKDGQRNLQQRHRTDCPNTWNNNGEQRQEHAGKSSKRKKQDTRHYDDDDRHKEH